MINRFLRADCISKYSLSCLKIIVCGGALIKPKAQKEMRSILPHVQMLQGYGRYHFNVIKYEIKYQYIIKTRQYISLNKFFIAEIRLFILLLCRNDGTRWNCDITIATT